MGLINEKKNFARAAHIFVHFFAIVLHDLNVKLPSYTIISYLSILVRLAINVLAA